MKMSLSFVCVFNSEEDSLILEMCREHGPTFDTYSRISQILNCHSADQVRSALCVGLQVTEEKFLILILL